MILERNYMSTLVNLTVKEIKIQKLNELLHMWVAWLFTRRFYAAPVPQNILARMMEQNTKIAKEPPNARNDALCCAWNLVIQDAKENEDSATFLPFMFVYFKAYRPYKISALAIELGIDSDTVYQRAHSAAIRYYNKALQLEVLHGQMQREIADLID